MTFEKEIAPPKPTKLDAIIEGVKAGLSGPGGIVGAVLKSPLEKRRDAWMRQISEALLELNEKVEEFSLQDLVENEKFISACLSATQAALRTHVIEKRLALRNAVLNAAITPNINATKVHIFINSVDTMTIWHLKILDLFSNPIDWANRNNRKLPSKWFPQSSQLLEFAYPEIANQREFYTYIIKDLSNKNMLVSDSMNWILTSASKTKSIVTNMGEEFLQFISNPIPETTNEDE
jgi:hypothetical protein